MYLYKKSLLINAIVSLSSISSVYAASLRKTEEVHVLGPDGCTYVQAEVEYERGKMPSGPEVYDSCILPNGQMVDIKGLTNEIKSSSLRDGGLVSGETTLSITGATISDGVLTIPVGVQVDFKRKERDDDEMGIAGGVGITTTIDKATVGTKKVLVIRADAPDSSTGTNMDVLSDNIFGTDGDPVNLKSQYTACSYGQLNFEPIAGTWNGNTVTAGVVEVSLNSNVKGVDNSIVRTNMVSAADTKYGSLQSKVNSGELHHVMLCIPSGTLGTWIAYAYINHWLSVYNDDWCNYVSAQMHEVGHNLYLAHSGETSTYDDQSGLMGYSYSNDDTPEMCFNAPKNWQLGWYPDGAVQIASGESFTGRLIGLADYSKLSSGDEMMIKISGYSIDYYISFNRKSGINSGTQEGGNQVLVHSRAPGTGYEVSYILAKLSTGQSHTIEGKTTVTVNSISLTSNPGYAEVSIVGPNTEGPTTVPPTDAPITPPTTAPINPPTLGPSGNVPTPFPTEVAPTPFPTNPPVTSPPTESPPTEYPTQSPPTDYPMETPPTLYPTQTAPSPNQPGPTPSPTMLSTPSPTQTTPTMHPTHTAPTLYPTHTPPTAYPTGDFTPPTPFPTDIPPTQYPTGSTCAVKGDPCTKHKECCKKKCNLIKNFCRK